MPFETVNEPAIRQRRIKVCKRCRRQIEEKVQHRGAYSTAGSIGGSLGTSMAGSMVLGRVLGPVGAIGGAIGGAIVGSRAGAAASDTICDAVETTGGDLCDACQAAPAPKAQNWGGGRLGAPDEPPGGGAAAGSPPAGVEEEQGPSIGNRVSGAAAAAGEGLSSGWNWVRSSVSGVVGGNKAEEEAKPQPSAGGAGNFQAFAGTGRTLGSSAPTPADPAARRATPSRLVAGGYGAAAAPAAPAAAVPPAAAAPAAAPVAGRSQMAEDEELARQLQEQFLREDQGR